jgi:hypothetical protein
MSRIGHSSIRAAMIYQHVTAERDRRIADALNLMIEAARKEGKHGDSVDGGDGGEAA